MLIPAAAGLVLHTVCLMLRVEGSGGSFPRPLSPAEEADCLSRMAQGDPAAREALIEHNLRLVAHIAKKYYAEPAEQDDLISIGTIGLIKAVSTYRPDRKVRLATYAARCIENAIPPPGPQAAAPPARGRPAHPPGPPPAGSTPRRPTGRGPGGSPPPACRER